MANITINRDWIETPAGSSPWRRLRRHMNVLLRAHRIARATRFRVQLVHDETSDPRRLADVGIIAREHRRYDWLGAMVRAMSGGSL